MKSDTTRMIVGFLLILVILIGWQLLYRPKPRVQPTPTAEVPPPAPTPAPAPTAEPKVALAPMPAIPVAETTVVLANDFLQLEFSNIGGRLLRVRLKKFDAELVPESGALLGTTLVTDSGAFSLAPVPMKVTGSDSSVEFSYEAGGIGISKSFVLGPRYALRHNISTTGAIGVVLDGAAGLALTETASKEGLGYYSFSVRNGRKTRTVAATKLNKPWSNNEPAAWVAARSKYFVLVLAGPDSSFDSCHAFRLEDGRVGFGAASHRPQLNLTLYLGPVDERELGPLGLGGIIAHGWTRPIELAMLWLLRLLYSLVRNWGLAIVIFAVLMKALLWPISRTQTKQMRQMQLLQPKLNELKAKYKDDQQKLNAETMQLYKLYKINPLAGCLPMLLQLPIFWALYAVLRNAIEMRGARFVLWLHDLSQPDTLFGHLPHGIPLIGGYAFGLLPVMMGVSFIAQNLITSTDKKNWALTIIFPVFITAIFLNLPSGLQLYWFMYNILSIGETLFAVKGGKLWRKQTSQ